MKESASDDYSITLLFEDYGTPVHITAMMVQEYLYTPNDGDAVGDFRVEKINPLESTIRFMRSKSEDIEFISKIIPAIIPEPSLHDVMRIHRRLTTEYAGMIVA